MLSRALARVPGLALAPALLSALATLTPGCTGLQAVRKPEPERFAAQTEAWISAVHSSARQGAWLVLRGYHVSDALVAAVTDAPVSHVVVYDRATDEVIEATAEGVHVSTLRDVLDRSHRVLIYEPEGWTEADGAAAVARARGVVGSGYDFLGLIGLGSDRRFYCSELAVWAYEPARRGWSVPAVIKPEQIGRFGRVLYDSGPRDRTPEPVPNE
jgi:hypothetical protein